MSCPAFSAGSIFATIASTSGVSGTMIKTISAPATHATASAARAAPSAARTRAFSGERLKTRTRCPASSRRRAIGAPIIPVPIHATSIGLFLGGSRTRRLFFRRGLSGFGGAPGEARTRGRRDQRDRNPQRENKSEQRRMPHPEQPVKKKRHLQQDMQQRAGISDAPVDSRKQLRNRHPLPEAMPGSVKAASTTDIGAGLE